MKTPLAVAAAALLLVNPSAVAGANTQGSLLEATINARSFSVAIPIVEKKPNSHRALVTLNNIPLSLEMQNKYLTDAINDFAGTMKATPDCNTAVTQYNAYLNVFPAYTAAIISAACLQQVTSTTRMNAVTQLEALSININQFSTEFAALCPGNAANIEENALIVSQNATAALAAYVACELL